MSNTKTKIQNNKAAQAELFAHRNKRTGYTSATEVLSSPTTFETKMTARGRRKLAKYRQVRYVSTEQPKPQADKVYEKVRSLSMGRLIGLMRKTARRIAEATRLLEDLEPTGLTRHAVEQQRLAEQNCLVAAQAEYQLRTSVVRKDCRAPNIRRREALQAAVAKGSL